MLGASPPCGNTRGGQPDALAFSLESCWQGLGGKRFNEIRHRKKSQGVSSRGAEAGGGAGPILMEPVPLGVLLPGMLSPLPNPVALEGFV